ncbi:hypothetical protein, partial [Alloprevotella tannerae]
DFICRKPSQARQKRAQEHKRPSEGLAGVRRVKSETASLFSRGGTYRKKTAPIGKGVNRGCYEMGITST